MPDDFKDDLQALAPTVRATKAEREQRRAQPQLPEVNPTMEQYLAMEAVSASLLCKLLDECPFAAWYESWLNPDRPPSRTSDEMDLGTIAHALLLEGSADKIAVIDPMDYPAKTTGAIPNGWTNNAIRAARDEARAAGMIPLLPCDVDQVNAMVDSAHEFIESLRNSEPAIWRMFQPDGGASEQTFTWTDDGVPCRMRTDRNSNDRTLICNVKTTGRSPEPDAWARSQLSGMGYYRGSAFYRRGMLELFGVNASYVYLVISCEPPYLCSLVGEDEAWKAAGDAEITMALRLWRKCADANRWPKYPTRVCYPEPPAYLIARYQEREAQAQYGGGPLDYAKLLETTS